MYSGDEQDAWDIPYLPTLWPACRRSPIPYLYLPPLNTPMLPYPTPPLFQIQDREDTRQDARLAGCT